MTPTLVKDKPVVGVAELPEVELDAELHAGDGGGGSVANGGGPPEPPYRGHHRYRPDRPPSWLRMVFYGAALIVCFLLGYVVGKLWKRIDRAAWGATPLFGSTEA